MFLRQDRCGVLGVLNVTPDSFSDGGRYSDVADAVAHGQRMLEEGADMIDIGGESTRPGAERVAAESELARIRPVITRLTEQGVPTSVDTTRAAVAEAAVEAGASVINDVSGGLADKAMGKVVAGTGATYVLMHWRGHSARMNELADYEDVVAEVCAELSARIDDALAAGVDPDAIVVDPGIGFAKRAEHDWPLLRRLDAVCALGFPVLVGASRKRFLGKLLADEEGTPRSPSGREDATAAVSALAAASGAAAVRVHDVRRSVDAVTVAAAWQRGAQ